MVYTSATLVKTSASLHKPRTVANLNAQVEHFDDVGAFADESVTHMLTMHVTAIEQFENTNQAGKVVKHIELFKLILDHQKELMTEEAYDNLSAYAQFFLSKSS